MGSGYRILITKRAAADLETIFDRIQSRSPQNAPRVVKRILNAINGLKAFPHRTIARGYIGKVKDPVRSLPVQSWIVFFRVRDDKRDVRVLRVRHGAQRRPRGLP
ncbi:MAG: toxin ParE1/3/4 [Phycisphaerales bacterium]|jgi:addiction module RelE/StbE family toxin|nr:toxin ParE1/3/4 [Phycisphaerales bacterium]